MSVRIFFAGDFCSKPSTQNISVDQELQNIIKCCDLSVVNFEVPLKPSIELPKDPFERFYQNDDAPEFLKSIGFNLFSIANNHMFDWGVEGYQRVKETFADSCFGAGTYEEAYKVKVEEVNGLKIGFLSLCYAARKGVFSDTYEKEVFASAYLRDLKVPHIINETKGNLDYLFVLPHAGIEYVDVPIPELIALYRDFIDWGADGVIASHPHCPQGWEEYKGKPIFYSLGNFFFNSKPSVDYVAKRPHWYEGLAVVLDLSQGNITSNVICTLNNSNKAILIDKRKERIEHNKYLCNLLHDIDAYKESYNNVLLNRAKSQLKVLSCNSLFGSFKSLLIVNVSFILSVLRQNFKVKELVLKQLINNDAEYSVLRRILNNK